MKGWIKHKLDFQFIYFIISLFLFHVSFRLLDWPGQSFFLLAIPLLFSAINLLTFIIKGFGKSIWEAKYLLIVLLYFMISLKVEFRYYNILLCIFLVILSILSVRQGNFKIPVLKNRLIILVAINIILILLPDTQVLRYIHAYNKQIWGINNNLSWEDFKGKEPENIEDSDACIKSDIYWKYNKVYNFPRVISISAMDETNSWVRPDYINYEGNLLKHEQLHFNITEWTRREFEDSINSQNKMNYEIASSIYDYFEVLRSERQAEYDRISKHGIDFIGQIRWDRKVVLEMN